MNSKADNLPLKLPKVLDLTAAEGLLGLTQQRLQDGGPLRIDASSVEKLTYPCIQIILAALKTYDGISIEQPSTAFISAFEDLALDGQLVQAVTDGQGIEDVQQLPSQDDTQPVSALNDMPEETAQGDLQQALVENDMQQASVESDMPVEAAQDAMAPESAQDEMQQTPDGMQLRSVEDDTQQVSAQSETPNSVSSPETLQSNENAMVKRILTIDDSKTMRDMLMLALVEAGFDVVQAVDGQDGIDVLGKERVDVVITDINMPRMDGYEVIRQLRSNPDFKATPILVLTTESEAEKKHLAREVGATGWMVKPFDPDQLVATLRKVAP